MIDPSDSQTPRSPDDEARRASDQPSSPPPPPPPLSAGPPPVQELPPASHLPPTPLPSSPAPRPRPTGGRCLFLAVLALLACGLLSGAVAIGAALFGVNRLGRSLEVPDVNTVREVETRQFEVGSAPRLIIKNDNGLTQVRGGDVRSIQVEATKRATGANAQQRLSQIVVDMTQTGDTVNLSYRTPNNINIFGITGQAVDFMVTVPASTAVEINSDNGPVTVESVRAPVNVETDNGPVTLRTIEGATNIKTDNGRVTLQQIKGRLEVETDNGPMDIQDAQADSLRLQSDNGAITFVGSLGEGDHEIRTSNGAVSVTLPRDQRLRLDVQTGNGGINNKLQLADASTSRNKLSGTLNGGGSRLTIRTDNGGVTLDQR